MSDEERYDGLVEELFEASDKADRERFLALVEEMKGLALRGVYGAAEAIAESLAFSKRWRDPEQAYLWYHVHWALEGYSTANDPDPPDPNHYYGKIGDFRNEAAVSELIDEFGLKRMAALDREAEMIIAAIPPSEHNRALQRTASRPLS